jgi:hypothetical protein
MSARVTTLFMSLTEVPSGRHREYDEWHALDHMPEQRRVEELVGSHRWVIPTELECFLRTSRQELARATHLHYYLFTDSFDRAMPEFSSLKTELEGLGRFYRYRIGHLNAPFRVVGRYSSAAALVDPSVVPYRPATGCILDVSAPADDVDEERRDELCRWYDRTHIPAVLGLPGVAGCWSFEARDPDRTGGALPPRVTVRLYWLDGDPGAVAESATPVLEDRPAGDRIVYRAVCLDNSTPATWGMRDR